MTSTAFSHVRGSVISWFGIVGGAITLFGNLQTVVDLADWARWIVLHWKTWISEFWGWIFNHLHMNLNRALIPYLTLAASQILISVGARLGNLDKSKNKDLTDNAFVNILFVLTPLTILYLLIIGPQGFLLVQVYSLLIHGNFDGLQLGERVLAFMLLGMAGVVAINIAPARAFGARLWLMLSCLGVILALNWISQLGISTKSPNL